MDAETPSGHARNLRRLDHLLVLLGNAGVLGEWETWWHEQRRTAGTSAGLYGWQIMDWIRQHHPELLAQAEIIIRS